MGAGMKADEIIRRLCATRYRRNFVLANYAPRTWWECDVFEITEAGFFREYEVKVSRSDFMADRKKRKTAYSQWSPGMAFTGTRLSKHDLLTAADPRGPQRFWYVTPAGLLKLDELPLWAGLIEFGKSKCGGWPIERVVRPAPKAHGEKVDPAVEKHARSVCYWRLHEALGHWKSHPVGPDVEFAEGI